VNGTQVGVLKQSNEVSFWSLLEGKYSHALETTVWLKILSNLSYQTLEWHLANQKVSRLLVSPDASLEAAIERNVKVVFWVRVWHCLFTIDAHSRWTYHHRARTVPTRLFNASCRWQCFPCHLCG
jgi:hypothetical protein